MASGQELATAYLSLTVSARGINKDIQREMSGIEGVAEKTGRNMGSKLASGLKTGAKAAGVAFAAVLGTALTKGFSRLSAIENAQASLSGLGNSAEDVAAIMKNALASVKGTAFGMDEAASTAATAVAAGIKPGKELEGVLRLVGDAATIGGSSMGEMGAIFNKVATSNKVQGDVIAQLNDRGIPIVQMLGKQLGVTSEEVTKMASEGEIGFETFRAAMEDGLGGAALKSGETTAGAFKNMLAALSRIGAGLLGGVFPYFKTVFGGITGLLDTVESKLTPLADLFGKELAGGIRAFGEAWKANDGDITSSGFPGLMERVAYLGRTAFEAARRGVEKLRPAFAQLGKPLLELLVALSPVQLVFKSLTPILPNLSALITRLAGTAATLATIVASVLTVALTALIPIMTDVVGWVAGFISGLTDSEAKLDILTTVLVVATAGFLAYKTAMVVTTAVTKAQTIATTTAAAAQRVLNMVLKANPIGLVITAITALVGSLVWFFTKTQTGQKIVAAAWAGIQLAVQTVSNWFKNTLQPTISIVIDSLGAAFRWLKDSVINPVWNGITSIISGVWNNGVKPVFDALSGFVKDTIPKAFKTGVDAVKTAWEKLKGIAKAPVKFVVDTVINGGLIAAFNKIAGSLPGIDKLPNVALPAGFANGGYTGDGGKYQPAGIVHAGEYVFTKEETRKAGVSNLARLAQTLRGYATGGLVHPIPGFGINSGFGRDGTDPSHTGADFAAPTGTPVRAAGPGIVSQAAWSNYGGGNEVKVNHPNGLQTWYSHLSSILARLGQTVKAGQLVGRVGSTGNSTGPHLHYTVMRDGQYVDPAGYLAGGGASGTSGSGGAAPSNPLEGVLGGLVSKFKAQFPGGGMFADMAIGAGQKIFTDAKDWVSGKLNGVKDAVKDSVKSAVSGIGRFVGIGSAGAPTVYDGGGWLEKTGRPQLVQHNRTKPDAVLSHEQWGTMTRIAENSGSAGGGVTINGDVYGATPDQIVDEWDTKQRRAATMHNLRKVTVG